MASVTDAGGVRSISYDNRGNTIGETRPGGGTVSATYDGYGRLLTYTRTGEPAQSNSYNGLDDRVSAASGSVTHSFVYDADGRVMGEYGANAPDVIAETIWLSPQVANDNAFGGDDGVGGYAPLAVATGSGASAALTWVHGNHLGVPLLFTDASGTAVSAPSASLPGFPGQMKTLSDLYYNRYRDYDSGTGRYIQADPIGLRGGSNPYAYANDNPLRWTDPEGLSAISIPRPSLGGGAAAAGRSVLDRLCPECAGALAMAPYVYKGGQVIGEWVGDCIRRFEDDDEGPCEIQKEEDEDECNQWNITGSTDGYHRREGYRLCMISAQERYAECRSRGMNPSRITKPLFLPTRRRGIPDPMRTPPGGRR